MIPGTRDAGMKDLVFTSYAFGPLYVFQQENMRQSILRIYPDANIRFWNNLNPSSMAECMVPGARTFHESLYGFKVHCVRNCINEGFKRVIFLDAAMNLEDKIDDVLNTAAEIGVLCTRENTDLSTVISDRCLDYIGRARESLSGLSLVGGSLYVFDFNNPVAMKIFEFWEQMEHDGIFGSEVEDCRGGLQGHRKDETCMALALHEYGVSPQGFDVLGYHNLGGGNANRKFTFYKLHHRGIAPVHGHSLNQSVIPLHGKILDLGCRDFKFANFFRELEYQVYPVDIGEFTGDYIRCGIAAVDGMFYVKTERDPDGTHIVIEDTGNPVRCFTLESFKKFVGVDKFDLIKMDIEGQELPVLQSANHPIAEQVTVEFHAHCGQTREEIDRLLDYLSQFYVIHNRVWEERHSAGFNYWDVLLIAMGPVT